MGNKAKNLQILKENSFLVPNFLVLNYGDNYKEKVSSLNKNIKYAVRSNMFVEDSNNSSFAGQFMTFININFPDIILSIEKVISGAKKYGLKDKQISVIVQEYIEFDYSGIAFTRSPSGGREMLIEYHNGIGEDIVSGKVIPKKVGLYHNEINYKSKLKKIDKINNIDAFINNIKKIEEIFNHPQDIEWGIKNGKVYFLQSRNITSINRDKYEEILFLENSLKDKNRFLYEKNEVSEIAPRPTNFTFSLLKKIYSKSGPINEFYKKRKIKVINKNYLKIIGNELYIDKEEELHSLLPSFSYLNNSKAKLSTYKGITTSFKNLIIINLLEYDKNSLNKEINNKLEKEFLADNLKESIDNFLTEYPLIYEINFFTAKVFKKLETILKNEQISFTQSLELDILDEEIKEINTKGLVGNSLDISDESIFFKIKKKKTSKKVLDIWDNISTWRKDFLTPFIQEAIFMQNLREKGRILTVKHISQIRECLMELGKELKLKNKKYIYFANIDELLKKKIEENILEERKKEFIKYNKYTFPEILRHKYTEDTKSKFIAVSNGIAKGKMVNKKSIKETSGDKILQVDILSPDLVEYFDEIKGIISNTGGILSHLAILAREKGIPIVSGYNEANTKLKLGDEVIIDGSEGKISEVEKI